MEKHNNLKHIGLITLIVGIVFIAISPFIFTHFSTGIIFNEEDSKIGTTIGGITAPITGLVGSILVYLALITQVKANERIQKQRTEDKTIEELHRKYNYLNEEISNFQLFTKNETHVYKSYSNIYALFGYADALKDGYGKESHKEDFIKTNVNHSNIYSLLSLFLLTIKDTLESKLEPERKVYFVKLASYINASKLYPPFAVRLDQCIQAEKETQLKCSECKMYHHKIPGIIYERLISIDQEIRNALNFYDQTQSTK